MPSAKKTLQYFIEDIPDSKIAPPTGTGTLHEDGTFRLDMQGITSNDECNLQVQVKYKPKKSPWAKLAPQTVAGPALVPRSNPWTADEVRQKLKDTARVPIN